MNQTWKFDDPPNAMCITTTYVLNGSPILRVYHDFDATWQFHGDSDQVASSEVASLVCLSTLIYRDHSLEELHDLPYGWRAERSKPLGQWRRFKNHPFSTFPEHGYYLEDAVWLSQYLLDIHPPEAEIRESLEPGQFVKLIFRFASEDSERADGECERIWVQVMKMDDDGNYTGTIENDPHHEAAKFKDIVHFHPLHVADLYIDE